MDRTTPRWTTSWLGTGCCRREPIQNHSTVRLLCTGMWKLLNQYPIIVSMLKLRMAAKVSLTSKHTLLDRGVFRELKDIHYFNSVGILFGTVTWPNEQDIAPETLLAEMLPPRPSTWIIDKFGNQALEHIIVGLTDIILNRNPDVKPKEDYKISRLLQWNRRLIEKVHNMHLQTRFLHFHFHPTNRGKPWKGSLVILLLTSMK